MLLGSHEQTRAGFTLLELLVVIALIGILASVLLPALSRAKAKGQDAACKNHLRQIGIALAMYVSDHNRYPSLGDWDTLQLWMDRLHPYNPVSWTNSLWNCPSYIANRGMTIFWATNTLAR
ncbi:MAG TPA: type II secretion system protein [Candidatus Acidoferrum sp.]|jgi:prepilin-type N-terminal cleavage/methylation domain-containing protein|nr:type II secretion system protein [Candidatus Acidoferrum sp.]